MSTLRPETGGHPPTQPLPVDPAPPSNLPAACRCDLESWASAGGEILVVRVSGEVDLATCPIFTDALVHATRRAPRHLVVDLAGMTFCCARGFVLLGENADAATAGGVGFALSGLTAHHHRVLDLVLPDPGPVRHGSVAAAVTALRAGDTLRSADDHAG